VNEIQLIRSQLDAERERAAAVAHACAAALAGAGPQSLASASALEEFRQASVAYLACVLGGFVERDRRLGELYARRPADDPERRSVETLLAGAGSSREALERLERAAGHSAGAPDDASHRGRQERWQDLARFFSGPWKARREAIEQRLAPNPRVADWRVVAGMDADSILEERHRYARVRQHLPAGTAAPADP
jgi:hypothetical protein